MKSDAREKGRDLQDAVDALTAHTAGGSELAKRASALAHDLTALALAAEGGEGRVPYDRDLDYLAHLAGEPDPLLLELEVRGRRDGIPIVDREVGRFLSVMVSCMLAGNILEIGTAYGYSTLWMSRAQPETGRIWTIDPDVQRTSIARSFFERAGVAERIDIINQPALAVLRKLPPRLYDIVFIDALKEEYGGYLELALPLVKHSGLVLVDNLLWAHRSSLPPSADDEHTTLALRRFNEVFLSHPALNATILPVGDGLGVGAKIR